MRPIGKQFHSTIISRIKVMAELDIAEKRVPQDGRFKLRMPGKTIDFRVSIMPSVHGEDAVIRILDKESISEQFTELRLDILGFPEAELKRFRKYIAKPYGMVLVTGPTGSGKTTTLYAALSEIKSVEDKIITIEDPVEYQLRGITQIPINEKKGLTFARGLRSILRHDPDKIMVGEIRDAETAQIAINSALTGHLVFTTVHANNVLDVLGRFLNIGVEAYQFVSALNCVLAQRLVRDDLPSLQASGEGHARAARGIGARPVDGHDAHVLRGSRLHRVRRHGLQRPHGHLRTARPLRPHSRNDPRQAPGLGNQEGGARGGHALPARVRRRARHGRIHHAARNQQSDVRRMSVFDSLRDTSGPTVALEIAAHQVSAASIEYRSGTAVVAAHATELMPPGALVPSLTAANIHHRQAVVDVIGRVLERTGRPRRLGLIVPDLVAKVSFVRFEQLPARAADLEQLVRWQVRKTAPFAVDEAQVSFVPGLRSPDGQEFVVSLARRAIVEEYESICAEAGAHAGVVDLATFNVINAVLASAAPVAASGADSDWLLVNIAPDYASIAILRGTHLIFFRNRVADEEGTLPDLVHQAAMYLRGSPVGWRLRARVPHRRRGRGSAARARCRASPAHSAGAVGDDRRKCRPAACRDIDRSDHGRTRAARHAGAARRPAASRTGRRMIRTNLSTRPFYNERIVSIWLLVCLLAVVVASVFNATRVLRYSRSDTELGTQASRDEARATELRIGGASADLGGSEADRVRLAGGATGERPDRSPDVFVDRALQPLRDDVAR